MHRLYAISFAIAAADTERFTLNKPQNSVSLHAAAWEDRRAHRAERLTGFSIMGTPEPSSHLIDRFAKVLAKGEVR